MKVAIVHNHEPKSVEVTQKLLQLLKKNAIELDDYQPDLVISVGETGRCCLLFIGLVIVWIK